jgi:hypothetical protein
MVTKQKQKYSGTPPSMAALTAKKVIKAFIPYAILFLI